MYFCLGTSPENTVQQYTEVIGRHPIPSYWSLGFHLCRWGYDNIENMKMAFNRTVSAGIPLEAQWLDIDAFDRNIDFTYDIERFLS